jgi:hypothetical protein
LEKKVNLFIKKKKLHAELKENPALNLIFFLIFLDLRKTPTNHAKYNHI